MNSNNKIEMQNKFPIYREMSFRQKIQFHDIKDKHFKSNNNLNNILNPSIFNKKESIKKKQTFINQEYLNLNYKNKKFKLEKFNNDNILSDISINDEFFNKINFDSSDDEFKIEKENELKLINLDDEELYNFDIKYELHPKNLNKLDSLSNNNQNFDDFLYENGYSMDKNYDQKIILIIFLLKKIINYKIKTFIFNLFKHFFSNDIYNKSDDTIKENSFNNNSDIEDIFNFIKKDL